MDLKMLLRASMIYGLAVVCLLVIVLALWQRMEIGANRETYQALTGRIERLQNDLDSARMELAAAERRAAVAEDALTRARTAFGTSLPGDAEEERLAQDLAEATRERDAARQEALALAQDLGDADKKLAEARLRLDTLEKQLSAQTSKPDALSDALAAPGAPASQASPQQPAQAEVVPVQVAPAEPEGPSVEIGSVETPQPEAGTGGMETGSLDAGAVGPKDAPDASPSSGMEADRLDAAAAAEAVPARAAVSGVEPGVPPAQSSGVAPSPGETPARTAATTQEAPGAALAGAGQVAPDAPATGEQSLPEVIPETAPAVAPENSERDSRTAARDLDANTAEALGDEPAQAEAPAATPPKPVRKAAKPKKKRTSKKKPSSSPDPFSIFPF